MTTQELDVFPMELIQLAARHQAGRPGSMKLIIGVLLLCAFCAITRAADVNMEPVAVLEDGRGVSAPAAADE